MISVFVPCCLGHAAKFPPELSIELGHPVTFSPSDGTIFSPYPVEPTRFTSAPRRTTRTGLSGAPQETRRLQTSQSGTQVRRCSNMIQCVLYEHSHKFSVCGKPHSNKALWTAYVAALAALGIATYRFCFRPLQVHPRDSKRD